ncbi:recombinase family protein [Paracoccus sp. SCSIO 75233]|uniref:recombinase family protein n=1 Tax=Paracoccus sp. SCSIO 75233 TaxID=3017782 RepID=UPI0022F0315C|nr:recombinase family protein [Paracoccus sp. SCSIO 75233]WBU55363.1 recombinase family protein [Paracoccus sp. SCSIO 75233]
MIFGYARVSTRSQSLDAQQDALWASDAERIFADQASGTGVVRPELERLIDQLRPGDIVMVTKYDRLARSLKELLELVERIRAAGADFRSLAEEIDTSSPAGRLVFHVFGSIAEFERARIAERTREGLEAARRRGRIGGRPPALTPEQRAEVRRMRDQENRPVAEIARLFRVSTHTVRRA